MSNNLQRTKLELKVVGLDDFTRLVAALGAWAEETRYRCDLTAAETELFFAAMEIEGEHNG